MNSKIRWISIICCFFIIMLITFPARAQKTEHSCVKKGQIVTFEGVTDNAESIVTYTIREGIGDNDTVFGGSLLHYIGETSSDENGKFVIKFSLNKTDNYILRIKDVSGDIFDKPIQYLGEADNGIVLIKEINSGDDNRIKKAIDDFDFAFNGKKWSDFKNSSIERWLVDCIKKNIAYENSAKFQKDFNMMVALYYINNANVASIVKECDKYSSLLGISHNAEVSKFTNNATDEQKRTLVKQLSSKPAQNTQMLVNAITDALNTQSNQGGGSSGGGSGSSGGNNNSGNKGMGFVGVQSPQTNPSNSVKTDNIQEVKISFSDLEQASWAREAVEFLASRGVVSGDGNGHFRPNDKVTREEFVKMVLAANDIPGDNTRTAFLDVLEKDWFYPYIGAAKKTGIISGISNNIFGVRLKITRQDAAVVIVRAADYSGKKLSSKIEFTDFLDQSNISDYAVDSVKRLYESGIVKGMEDGNFYPKESCTRAEAAKMIYGILQGEEGVEF